MAEFDILLVGTGVSGIATLKDILSELITNKIYKQLTIGVIEEQEKLWNGIPFGSKISANCLTITSVVEFLTNPSDKQAFTDWLTLNKERCLTSYLQEGGYTAQQWLQNNRDLVEANDWDPLFVPRYWYREYITESLQQLIQIATLANAVAITTLHGEAIKVKESAVGYEVTVRTLAAEKVISAEKLILAIGSPPIKPLKVDVQNQPFTYINDIYTRKADAVIDELYTALQKVSDAEKRNLLIVGSNASCTELLYLLSHNEQMLGMLNKVVVLSSSGALPQAIDTTDKPCPEFTHVSALNAKADFTYSELMEATLADMQVVNRDGVHTKNAGELVTLAMQLKQRLSADELQEFETNFGSAITATIRRMGQDYYRATRRLTETGKLVLLKGKHHAVDNNNGDALLTYMDAKGELTICDMPFAALVNCTGFESLNQCSATLINNLVQHDVCKVNPTGKGFEVNENFEANNNLYVMGPLLAGNTNKVIHFWHLENVARILYLTPLLTMSVLNDYKTTATAEQSALQSAKS